MKWYWQVGIVLGLVAIIVVTLPGARANRDYIAMTCGRLLAAPAVAAKSDPVDLYFCSNVKALADAGNPIAMLTLAPVVRAAASAMLAPEVPVVRVPSPEPTH